MEQKIYEKKYVWNTIDEAINMICSDEYNSKDHKDFIINNYSLVQQIEDMKSLLKIEL
ncbi:hypothetical protein [Clostridium sp. CTA-5]